MSERYELRSGKKVLVMESGSAKIFHGDQSVVLDETEWQSVGILAGWFE